MYFSLLTLACSILVAVPAVLVIFVAPSNKWLYEKLPRHRVLGFLLALPALLWSAQEAQVMLEGSLARFQSALYVVAAATAVLAYFFLHFIFARAYVGILLLLTVQVLHEAFVIRLPGRPLFSLVCYALALLAMVVIAQPWMFRELFNCDNAGVRRRGLTAAGALLGAGIALLVFAVLGALQ